MTKTYLFDWGDTLMVDFPDSQGKMCDWAVVKAVEGAEETLAFLSQQGHSLYIATGAAASGVQDIQLAFERVGLSKFISGYFCQANIGLSKGTPEFYQTIVTMLDANPSEITMVGDSIEKDIVSAIEAGLDAIWFNPDSSDEQGKAGYKQIRQLRELCR